MWVDEASDVKQEFIQKSVYPMLGGVGERVLVMASTAKNRHNWWNVELKKAQQPGSKVKCVVFNFKVCTDCREEGMENCEHALLLYPHWYDPEKAKEIHALANEDAMREMLGLDHDDITPAYDHDKVHQMINTEIEVLHVNQTIVLGIDPNSGGNSEYGLMAATVLDGRLVILGWGIPKVSGTYGTDNYAPRMVCDFVSQLFDRFGRGANVLISVESNTHWHLDILYRYVMEHPWASRVDWVREHGSSQDPKKRKLGLWKSHDVGCKAQHLWTTWMHEAAGVCKDPVIFTGSSDNQEARYEWVKSELLRQFLQYEQIPTDKGGITFTGKKNGNDDLTGGAGTQVVMATKLVLSQERRNVYRRAFFVI